MASATTDTPAAGGATSDKNIISSTAVTSKAVSSEAVTSKADTLNADTLTSKAATSNADTLTSKAATTSLDSDIQARLNDLPLELFDAIKDLTIIGHIESGPTQCDLTDQDGRDQHRACLKILQLSRATRALGAKTFYAQRTFVAPLTCFNIPWTNWIPKWLDSLSVEHQQWIGGIAYAVNPEMPIKDRGLLDHFRAFLKIESEEQYTAHMASKFKLIALPGYLSYYAPGCSRYGQQP